MTEQELLQVPEELRELFIALDKQGWNPQLCDTLVPYYANGVPCGMPSDVGDIRHDEYDLMPRDMVVLNQTFTIYDRLRREEKEEPKRIYISALAFLHMLPKQFTTAEAVRIGEAMGIKENAVAKKLAKLSKEYYIGKVRQGVFVKTSKMERNNWKKQCTLSAA